MSITRLVSVLVAGFLASCAFITVNVYFPEKEVKKAFQTLDDRYLKEGGETKPPVEAPSPEAVPPPGEKPQSLRHGQRWSLSLGAAAWAAEDLAGGLVAELSRMPEVVRAYEEMKGRLQLLDRLRDSGAVGESNAGLLVVRDRTKLGGSQAVVDAENTSRTAVIAGMARAIVRTAGQPETPDAIGQVRGRAAASFAQTRQDAARQGWWIQLVNGRWVQK
ncbi:MAG: DUF1318 domain-containing protein [Desulfuromonadales bacterium]|nr:MAG: DUF1318 domain-containing protein [Desulfuromonadales bacterium]